jgi:hypothetical protein
MDRKNRSSIPILASPFFVAFARVSFALQLRPIVQPSELFRSARKILTGLDRRLGMALGIR